MQLTVWREALAGAVVLAGVSFRRLVRSRQTIVCALLLGFVVLVALAWSLRRERSAEEFVTQILIPAYTAFLLPIFCLCFAAASIAGDREEQTLPYLLVSPVPRPLVYAAKYSASLAVALCWTLGGLLLTCEVAGRPGRETLGAVWPAVLLSSVAYVGLFHLFSVLFRRATIIGLAYALFLETLVGSMPGIVKRLAISFYTECLIFEAAAPFGVGESGHHDPALYLPVSADVAFPALCLIAAGTFVLGAALFWRHEYE
jgi:ABC-type transport system involved in multi-copper enzyme maturation permease subunit